MKQAAWFILLLLILAACGAKEPSNEPPEIAYGRDVCEECGMIIDEARFAASYVTMTGDVRKFESIEDMIVYHQEHQEKVHIFWVHDYESEEWIRADTAFFVASDLLQTPMGGGLIAAANEPEAQTLAEEWQGSILTFDDLLKTESMMHSTE